MDGRAALDIRTGGGLMGDRVAVAGGHGGDGGSNYSGSVGGGYVAGKAGHPAGVAGNDGSTIGTGGKGGTQTAGGKGDEGSIAAPGTDGGNGELGPGGKGGNGLNAGTNIAGGGGGGGAGYYGGGGGRGGYESPNFEIGSGAGGGSSYGGGLTGVTYSYVSGTAPRIILTYVRTYDQPVGGATAPAGERKNSFINFANALKGTLSPSSLIGKGASATLDGAVAPSATFARVRDLIGASLMPGASSFGGVGTFLLSGLVDLPGTSSALIASGLDLPVASSLPGVTGTRFVPAFMPSGHLRVLAAGGFAGTTASEMTGQLYASGVGGVVGLLGVDVVGATYMLGGGGLDMLAEAGKLADALLFGNSRLDLQPSAELTQSHTFDTWTAAYVDAVMSQSAIADVSGRAGLDPRGSAEWAANLSSHFGGVYQGGAGGAILLGSSLWVVSTSLSGKGEMTPLGGMDVQLGPLALNSQGFLVQKPLVELGGRVQLDAYSAQIVGAIVYRDVGVVLIPVTPQHRVVVTNALGIPLDEVPFSGLEYSFVLNGSGACGFSAAKNHPKVTPDLLAPGRRQVLVYRDGNLAWGGYLWAIDAGSGSDEVRIVARDWFSRLERRYIDPDVDGVLRFKTIEQIDIAWGLIEYAQARESYGITRAPSTPTGKKRTARYETEERVPVAGALQEFTEYRDGFDFEIKPDKSWNVYYPHKGADTGIVLELGGGMGELSYSIDADDLVTEITALGQGSGKNTCLAVVRDNGSIQLYGLLQDSASFSRVKHYGTLHARAEEELRAKSRPLWQPRVTLVTSDPPFGSYSLGDRLRLRGNDGFLSIDKKFRVVEIAMRLDQDGRETTNLTFDDALVP